jgi:4-hydroxybenzoate polyprenyltransferase
MTAILAVMAGGPLTTAARLAGSMIALQASIGALNDLVDAERDAGHKPRKPIAGGVVRPSEARFVAAVAVSVGLVMAAPSGVPTLLVAVGGVGAGYLYDLRLKGTAASWLPFALGIPLLPVFAWLGATGTVPPSFAVLVPLGVVAGAALAIANALADRERDVAAGTPSVATALGASRAWLLHAGLHGIVIGAAIGVLGFLGLEVWPGLVAGAMILTGIGLAAGGTADRRELGWEVEAVGVGLLAVAWLAGVASLRAPA